MTSDIAGLDEHRHLRPRAHRERVRGAERGGVRVGEVQIIGIHRTPVRRRQLGSGVLREREARLDAGVGRALGRTAAIELPVPEAEDDEVGEPDRGAAPAEQVRRPAQTVRAVQDVVDEQAHAGHRADRHDRDQHDRRSTSLHRAAVDAPGSRRITISNSTASSTGNSHQPASRPRWGVKTWSRIAASTAAAMGHRGSVANGIRRRHPDRRPVVPLRPSNVPPPCRPPPMLRAGQNR